MNLGILYFLHRHKLRVWRGLLFVLFLKRINSAAFVTGERRTSPEGRAVQVTAVPEHWALAWQLSLAPSVGQDQASLRGQELETE